MTIFTTLTEAKLFIVTEFTFDGDVSLKEYRKVELLSEVSQTAAMKEIGL